MRSRVPAMAALAALAALTLPGAEQPITQASVTPVGVHAAPPQTFLGPVELARKPELQRTGAPTEAAAHASHTHEVGAAATTKWKTRWRRPAPATTPISGSVTSPATTPTTTTAPTSTSFTFLARGADGSAARWNACAPVRWVFNPANAPAGGLDAVRSAFDELSASSGLRFEYAGTTTTPVSFEYLQAQSYQSPGPVMVGWTPRGHSIFASQPSSVVGFARVRYVQARDVNGSESFRIFAGVIAFDSADTAPLTGPSSWRSFALHEIGHVAGLGHPSDSTQIMHSVIPARTSLNTGDRAGLGYVGTPTPCMSRAF